MVKENKKNWKKEAEWYEKKYNKYYNKWDKADNRNGLYSLLLLFLLVVLFVSHAFISVELSKEKHELGQAICEQQYDMDLDKYDGGYNNDSSNKLYCKEKESITEERYDGIAVSLTR